MDGVVDPGEECDDANDDDNDSCVHAYFELKLQYGRPPEAHAPADTTALTEGSLSQKLAYASALSWRVSCVRY